ncbi:MAG: Carboxy-terminal domain (CTD) phosphatase [Pycnora praestabilis]|nr:MAG: Carboxy-terminal domain (CTD) phosphatase [Pycnora praestabilis]
MLLRLAEGLHYPITVTELLKQPNEYVERLAPLFSYTYMTTVTEGNKYGDTYQVERPFSTQYQSTVDGTLKEWKIHQGMIITNSSADIAKFDEPCSHDMQFGGMCTMCGKDMTEYENSSIPLYRHHFPCHLPAANGVFRIGYNTIRSDAERATITMIHDNVSLTVSQNEATRVEEDAKRRLLAAKKLSLVVDLDQTIIHATVDPTVAEWQQDKENPNHEAVKDVRAFQLIDDGPGARGCWYYIKLRPGLNDFLENVSKIYELHIYTMGTRAYAQNIAKIVDPHRRIFGDRILSRDESGSMTAKNLQRLFPVDTKMVVIIDDRGDVWKWSENLIKVRPYDFFVGIGDINSSFLPEKPELNSSPKVVATTALEPKEDSPEDAIKGEDQDLPQTQSSDSETNGAEASSVSTLEQLVSMGGGDDPSVLQAQASKQDETLAAQLQDRPLLQQQKLLDAEDEAAVDSSSKDDNGEIKTSGDTPGDIGKSRQNLLQDDDTELQHLERNLSRIHHAFFEEYDKALTGVQGGRIAALRGEKSAKMLPTSNGSLDLKVVPDIKFIMPQMKLRVFAGIVLVLSGVVPLGTDIQSSDIAFWAKSFGAQIVEDVGKRVTHVVAARNRTAKVRQAARRPRINIVTTQWLFDSISHWQRLEEEPYLIPVHPEDRTGPASSPGDTSLRTLEGAQVDAKLDNNATLSSSEEEDGSSEEENGKLSLKTQGFDDLEQVGPPDLADDDSPIGVDWNGMNEDLKEFLGSENEDSDSESMTSELSIRDVKKHKRKRSASSSPESTEGEDDLNGSSLSLRKKRALDRTTTLKEVSVANDRSSSLPSPETTGAEEEAQANETEETENPEDDGSDFDLEKDLEAELEAQEDEERRESEV